MPTDKWITKYMIPPYFSSKFFFCIFLVLIDLTVEQTVRHCKFMKLAILWESDPIIKLFFESTVFVNYDTENHHKYYYNTN